MSFNTKELDPFDEVTHPLDFLEDISQKNAWAVDRSHEDKVTLNVKGIHQTYRMVFVWDDESATLQFTCKMDVDFDPGVEPYLPTTLMDINAKMWLGHFIYSDTRILAFRHAIMFRGINGASGHDHIQDLVMTATVECDRYYPLFELIRSEDIENKDKLYLALSDSEGSA